MKRFTFFFLLLTFIITTGTAYAQITGLEAPQLVAPDSGSTGQPTSLTLEWDSVMTAAAYEVQVSTDSGFSNLVVDSTQILTTSLDISGLQHLTGYYWRVQATNMTDTSAWSGEWNFTTIIEAPATPVLEEPADGATGISTNPVLDWRPADRADTYHLQVAKNPDFSSPVVDQASITTDSLQISNLGNDSTYYWRVQASNSGGTSEWSQTRNFTTKQQPPTAPVLVFPSNGATGISITPTLNWDAADRADTYQVQVAADSNFTSLLVNAPELITTEYQVSNSLDYTTRYYWRVRASNNGGAGEWSQVRNFTTTEAPPPAPTLVTPGDGATGVAVDPTRFEWNNTDRAETYRLQVASDSTFSNLAIDRTDLTVTAFDTSALANSSRYFWRVQASNEGGTGDWSAVRDFTTIAGAPATPALVSPDNGATGISTSPTLDWNVSSGADSYQVQLATDSNFSGSGIVADSSGLTATEFQVSGLNNSTQYFWRVQASNEGGTSSWSQVRDFTTIASAPATPTLLSPESGATGIAINPTSFSWNIAERAETYRLQVATDSSFSTPSINRAGLTSTSFDTSALDNASQYYWRVQASNEGGDSEWSSVRDFTTIEGAPAVPTLVSPDNGATGISTAPILDWNASSGADTYRVQVDTDSQFSNPFTVDQDSITADSLQISGLDNATQYFWRVQASNSGGNSSWSQVRNFTTIEAAPSAPMLVTPEDGATGVPVDTTRFDWNTADRADTYHLQVATNSSFSTLAIDRSGLTATFFDTSSALANSTQYYWRVQASNEGGNSGWSAARNFTTIESAPAAPVLVSPNDGATGIATSPTLDWNASSGADIYRVQVDTDSQFSDPFTVDQDSITADSLQISGLDNAIQYYWRVQASNEGGNSGWSAARNFTTIEAAPAAPVLASPQNGIGNVSVNPLFQWNVADRAETYTLQAATDAAFASPVINQAGISATEFQAGNLNYSTNYFWRVKASNSGGDSDWSSAWSFITRKIPQPVLISPGEGAQNQPTNPTLDWDPVEGANSYDLQVASDSSFNNTNINLTDVAPDQHQAQNLEHNTKYYWRVRANSEADTSEWARRSFTTIKQVPATPVLVAPDNGVTNQPTTLTLNWNPADRAETYQVQVDTDQNFTSPFTVNQSGITADSLEISNLDYSTTYYWRVRASNSGGNSNWSTTGNFTTVMAPPAAPVLESPANGATGQPTNPILDWNPADGADSYRIKVSKNQTFTSVVVDSGGITETIYQPKALDHSTTYYWKVSATNAGGTSESETWSFTTEEPALAQPQLVDPPNGAADRPTTLPLSWSAVTGAESYQLQVATDENFLSQVRNQSGITGTEFTVQNLDNSTTYYWRVRASSAQGESNWSEVRSFITVIQTPPAPTLASPGDGAVDQPTTLTLEWNSTDRANTYRLQVATDQSFNSIVFDQDGLNLTSQEISGLDHSTTYYWRVNASNKGGTSGWSQTRDFTTIVSAPATPALASPADGVGNQPTAIKLNWNAANRADTYRVQIAEDPNFNNLVADTSGIASNSVTTNGLDNSSTYYWRVNASNKGGTSGWSQIWRFTTRESALDPPILATPKDGATDQPTTLSLDWNRVNRADSYRLQIATDPNFLSEELDQKQITSTSYEVRNLDHNQTYYWRVRASNSLGTSNWSEVRNFTTVEQPPPAPVLTAPEDASTDIATDPLMEWNPAERADTYQIQIANNANFTNMIVDKKNITSAAEQVTGLSNSTTYYWRVRASNKGGTSNWSQVWSFTTLPAAPPAPQLVAPANNATEISTTPTLDWAQVERADTYDFQISTEEDFRTTVIDWRGVISTSFDAELEGSTTYYWRVRAVNSGGASDWSQVRNFTTVFSGPPIQITAPSGGEIWSASNTQTISWKTKNDITTLQLSYSIDDGISWQVIEEAVDASTGNYIWQLPDISSEQTKIRISNADDISVQAISKRFIIYPTVIDVQATYSFSSSPGISDYQLIGLPSREGLKISGIFSGEAKKDWNAYFDNGQESDFLVEYDGSEQFTLKPGRAFWAISKNSVQVSEKIQTVPLKEDSTYSISIHPGWNIISNPFDKELAWSSIQSLNNLSDPIWGFNGSFSQSTVLEPYKGYYFFNRNDLDSLRIPYATTDSVKTQTQKRKNKQLLTLSVEQGDKKLSSIQVGFDPELAKNPGQAQQFAPPGNFQDYNLKITSDNYSRQKWLAAEIRSEIGEEQSFPLKLKAKPGSQIQFEVEGLSTIRNHEVYLVSERTGKFYDLRSQSPVGIKPEQEISNYTLLIGTRQAIESNKEKFKPETFTLSQNYPNPFNGQTVFEYTIPASADNQRVELAIYNILGRKVATLIDAKKPAGPYTVRWNADGLASGVYFYRLKAGKFVKTKKLTLIK